MRELLKRNEVIAIRRQYAAGHTIQEIATAYGRTWETIADCVHGRTYVRIKDVREPPHPEPPPRFRVPVAREGHPGARPRQIPSPQPPAALADPRPAQPSGLAAGAGGGGPAAAGSIPALLEPPASEPLAELVRLLPISCRIVTFPLGCPLRPPSLAC